MRVTTEQPQEGMCVLLIELPPERLSNELDIAWQQECQSAAIPGFRPGKAPRAIVQRYVDTHHQGRTKSTPAALTGCL